ncbi:MAG: ABC transporter ATP-binding protein/permease [Magnetococcus sp. DMHC-1]|nr:ABC transporter ATP-binding protein [Magnetococcales bacterium]
MMALSGFLEGISVVLLVPILNLAMNKPVEIQGVGSFILEMFQASGVPVSLLLGLEVFFFIFLLQAVTSLLRDLASSRLCSQFNLTLRHELFQTIFAAEWPFFSASRKGSITNSLTDEVNRAVYVLYYFSHFATNLFMLAVYFCVALLVSWQLTVGVLASGSVVVFFMRRLLSLGSDLGNLFTLHNVNYKSAILEYMENAKIIKASAMEEKVIEKSDFFSDRVANNWYGAVIFPALNRAVFEMFMIIQLCLAIYVGIRHLGMGLPDILVLLFVFYRLFPRLQQFTGQYFNILNNISGLKNVEELLKSARMYRETWQPGTGIPFRGLGKGIQLRQVGFSHVPNHPVLTDIHLDIPKGSTIAVVGGSGSGKSTLLDLIMGLLRPQVGQIYLDDLPLANYDPGSWRSAIGYVSQETLLLHDTIAANIGWGFKEALDKELIQKYARMAQADQFIQQLPEGYDTIIGDQGMRLSGGQKQRLALARALAREPALLVLDEATSALDSESERLVQQTIDQLAKSITILMIAHRFSTIRNADLIVVLKNGHIVDQGTWQELTNRPGPFQELLNEQKGGSLSSTNEK